MRKPIEFAGHPMPFPERPRYRGFCAHVVDGDTVDLLVDVGLFEYSYRPFRLNGYDAYEVNRAEERERGLIDKRGLEELILKKQVEAVTYKDSQTFDRFKADIRYLNAQTGQWLDVVSTLKQQGYGKS